jgi:hypothetical protein
MIDSKKKDSKLFHIKPLSQPNQKLELCALYAPQAIDPDHSIRQYEHDTKANPWKYPFSKEK